MKKKIIALIPARSGSERLKNKNIKNLNNKPLLYYAINSAVKSKIFDKVVVSTDSIRYKLIAKKYGAEVPFLRPKKFAKSTSMDFDWVNFTLNELKKKGLNSSKPYYNMQMKSLPNIFVQNASLEISKISNLTKYKTITGKKIVPFFTKKYEGFDINYEFDLVYANYLLKQKKIKI